MDDIANLPFLNSDLDTTDKSVFGYMKKHYPVGFAVFIFALIVLLGTIFLTVTGGSFLPSPSSSMAAAWLFAALFPCLIISLIYVGAFYGFVRSKINKAFVKHFAEMMGYALSNSASFTTVSGDTFQLGSNGRIYNILSGTYQGHPIRIFDYQFMRMSGKSPIAFTDIIFEIQFTHILSEMNVIGNFVIDSHISSPVKISLEGDFGKYFSVYTLQGTQLENLEVMTPDLMQFLVDHYEEYKNMSFECHGDKLYIHTAGRFEEKKIKDFTALYSLADILISKIDRIS